jgi:hypothetical protein
MCRTKELGGRRCPQHTDPVKHAAYNARRRELYAAKKVKPVEEFAYTFPPLDVIRREASAEEWQAYCEDRNNFSNIINPGWDAEDSKWSDKRWDSAKWKPEKAKLDAVLFYTDDGFPEVRSYLEGLNDPVAFHSDEYYEKVVRNLDLVVSKAKPPEQPRRLYRGLSMPKELEGEQVDQWIDERFPVNGIISQKNYMSTSLSPESAVDFSNVDSGDYREGKAVVFEIMSKQGAPIGDGVSYHQNSEREVLMPRNARFKVVGVHKKVVFNSTAFISKREYEQTVIQLVDAS